MYKIACNTCKYGVNIKRNDFVSVLYIIVKFSLIFSEKTVNTSVRVGQQLASVSPPLGLNK